LRLGLGDKKTAKNIVTEVAEDWGELEEGSRASNPKPGNAIEERKADAWRNSMVLRRLCENFVEFRS